MTIWFGQRGSKRSPGAGQGYGWENLNAGVRSQPHTITTSRHSLLWHGCYFPMKKRGRHRPVVASPSRRRQAMNDPWEYLRVDVIDDEIIVSLPSTSYSVTYFKRENSPQLFAKNIPMTDDTRTPIKLSDFLDHAWAIANDKARVQGWIV